MGRTAVILVFCLGVFGCEKGGATVDPDRAPFDVSTPPVAEPEPEPEPEPVEATEPDPESALEPVVAPDDRISGSEALALAESLATEAISAPSFVVSPAVSISWPPTSPQVVFFVYPLRPTKADVTKYTCGAAEVSIQLNVETRETTVEKLPTGKALGALSLDRGITTDDPLHGAQEALFEIAAGDATPEKRRYLLRRYVAWLDAHPLLAKDLSARAPAFVAFVSE